MSSDSTQWWLRWDTRNSRSQWWMVQIPLYIVSGILSAMSNNGKFDSVTVWSIIALIISLGTLYLYFASNARRFHDRGKSGWWSLIGLIPIVGTLWILIECGFLKGNPGANQWGAPVS